MTIFFDQDCKINLKYNDVKTVNLEEMKEYAKYIVGEIEKKIIGEKSMEEIGNADKYQTLFVNAAFQMEKMQEELQIKMPDKVKSIRTALVFLEQYEPSLKSKRMNDFVSRVSQDTSLSYYQHALNYFNSLGEGDEDNEEKMRMLTEFKANTLFLEWFKTRRNEREDDKCFKEFINNCDS